MKVDVIILSNCIDEKYFQVNINCIRSLLESEAEIDFHVILVESNREFDRESFSYPFTNFQLIVPGEIFNFNRFLNIAIPYTKENWVLFSNNDVIYHKGWLTEILNIKKRFSQVQSFCPFDQKSPYLAFNEYIYKTHHIGYRVPIEFVGWCYLFEREVITKIGQFDEQFDLYFQDNDLALTLRKNKIIHAMIPTSFVEHLGGYTTGTYDASRTTKYKEDKTKFIKKWKTTMWYKTKEKLKHIFNMLSPYSKQ